MIPVFATAGVLTAPLAPLLSSGYVPGNTLAAQHLNWYLYHLTAEINNVLVAQGISQLSTDDTQLVQALIRQNIVISTSGTVTVAAQFARDTLTRFNNSSGSSNYVIGSGAVRAGIEIIIEAMTSRVLILNGSGSALLGSGCVRLLWDGSQWCKIGGNAFLQVFTSGSAQTWITPWKGSYRDTVVGGGGGGGGGPQAVGGAGGGGGGGETVSVASMAAGSILTYTVGGAGSAGVGATGDGTSGGSSVLSGSGLALIATGGGGGGHASVGHGGLGGSGSGGQLNIGGNPGGSGGVDQNTNPWGGNGGSSPMGGGGRGGFVSDTPVTGSAYGGGGGGWGTTAGGTGNGAAGSPGVVVIEF